MKISSIHNRYNLQLKQFDRCQKPSYIRTEFKLKTIFVSGINQTKKDQYCMISLNVWNLKKKRKSQKIAEKQLLGSEQSRERWVKEYKHFSYQMNKV